MRASRPSILDDDALEAGRMADHDMLRAIGAKHGLDLLLDRQMRGGRSGGRPNLLRHPDRAPSGRDTTMVPRGRSARTSGGHRPKPSPMPHARFTRIERQLCIFGAEAAVDEQGVADLGDRRGCAPPIGQARPTGLHASLCSTQPSGVRASHCSRTCDGKRLGIGGFELLAHGHVKPFAAGHRLVVDERRIFAGQSCSDCRRAGSSPRDCRGRR